MKIILLFVSLIISAGATAGQFHQIVGGESTGSGFSIKCEEGKGWRKCGEEEGQEGVIALSMSKSLATTLGVGDTINPRHVINAFAGPRLDIVFDFNKKTSLSDMLGDFPYWSYATRHYNATGAYFLLQYCFTTVTCMPNIGLSAPTYDTNQPDRLEIKEKKNISDVFDVSCSRNIQSIRYDHMCSKSTTPFNQDVALLTGGRIRMDSFTLDNYHRRSKTNHVGWIDIGKPVVAYGSNSNKALTVVYSAKFTPL